MQNGLVRHVCRNRLQAEDHWEGPILRPSPDKGCAAHDQGRAEEPLRGDRGSFGGRAAEEP